MKKYEVIIEEMISQDFEVDAETYEEAINIAKHKYNIGEFVLTPGNLISKKLAIVPQDNVSTEWIEF